MVVVAYVEACTPSSVTSPMRQDFFKSLGLVVKYFEIDASAFYLHILAKSLKELLRGGIGGIVAIGKILRIGKDYLSFNHALTPQVPGETFKCAVNPNLLFRGDW